MHEQQLKLQQEAEGLAERLQSVLHDKFQQRHNPFDADAPIDKTLSLLQGIVEASPCRTFHPCVCFCYLPRPLVCLNFKMYSPPAS